MATKPTATSTTTAPVAPLVMVTAGVELPLLHFRSAKENDCFGVLAKKADGTRYLSKYGVGIPALAENLPDTVTIKGDTEEITLHLEKGFTDSNNPKVSFSGTKEVPGQGTRMVRVNISQTKSGWNVIAKVIPAGGGAGGRVTSVSDLW